MVSEKRGRGAFDGWSKSSLKSLLEGCSWQWALQRLGGLPGGSSPHSAAGTGMHAAIEWHEQCRIEGTSTPDLPDLLHTARLEALDDGANITAEIASFHGGADLAARWATELTHTWHESGIRQTLLGYTPEMVEPHYETDKVPGPHTLRGYIDWVGRDPDGTLTVIDWKSASNLKRWNNPAHHAVEAAAYLYLLATCYGLDRDEPVRMEWHVVSRNGESTILVGPTFDESHVSFVYDRVSEAQAILDGALFTPNPSWNLCSPRWCAFYHGCQVTGILGPDHVDFQSAG